MTKRYYVYTFPNSGEAPRGFRNKYAAFFVAWFLSFSSVESRVIDEQTGKHLRVY